MLIRVTAMLSSPVVLRDDIHLDAIMEAAHPEAKLTHFGRGHSRERIRRFPIPLVQITWRGHTVPLCSAAQVDDGVLGRDYIVKRRDGHDIDYLTRSYSPGQGPGKNRMVSMMTIAAPEIYWLCDGSWRGIKRILRRTLFIGSMRAKGYGSVRQWRMDAFAGEPAIVAIHDGITARRSLPREWCSWTEESKRGACTAPYWHPMNMKEIVPAGSRCQLELDVELKAKAVHNATA